MPLLPISEISSAGFPHNEPRREKDGAGRHNTSGWSRDGGPVLVAAYTSTGRGECMVYSNDRGRTWTEYERNPAGTADAIVYSSLAARAPGNRQTLERLLQVVGPLRLMDVNLRPPFDDTARVLALASHADWLKVNEQELAALTGLTTGERESSSLPPKRRGLRLAWTDFASHAVRMEPFSRCPPVRSASPLRLWRCATRFGLATLSHLLSSTHFSPGKRHRELSKQRAGSERWWLSPGSSAGIRRPLRGHCGLSLLS